MDKPALPLFYQLSNKSIALIGGDIHSLEIVATLLTFDSDLHIKVIANQFIKEWDELEEKFNHIKLVEGVFKYHLIALDDLIIFTGTDEELAEDIRYWTRKNNKLLFAKEFPLKSDFSIGEIVHKRNLTIGISSHYLSPTLDKRIKEVLEDALPSEISESVDHLHALNSRLKGDFSKRVTKLNKITSLLVQKHDRKWHDINYKKIILSFIGIITIMISGHIVLTLVPPSLIWDSTNSVISELDSSFLYFMLGGFIAQMIDGALGMAYGVSATTFLLSFGISPAVASMSVHASEIFTSGVSGLMHLKFGNVHHKLFKAIVIPGVLGAILGAYLLTSFEHYSAYIKPIVGLYTLFLGSLIIYKVLRKNKKRKRVKHAGYLATLGGFLDSIGGGGWGPVVSSTLIASGKNPRLVVGSVNLAEFFVSLASSFTFFTILGASHWQTIVGLILGGVCAAPIAANLSRRLNIKAMMLLVGIVVIIVSLRIIIISIIG